MALAWRLCVGGVGGGGRRGGDLITALLHVGVTPGSHARAGLRRRLTDHLAQRFADVAASSAAALLALAAPEDRQALLRRDDLWAPLEFRVVEVRGAWGGGGVWGGRLGG